MEHHVEGQDIAGIHPGRRRRQGCEVPVLRGSGPQDGGEVHLWVQDQPLVVHPPIQVDRQLGDPGHGTIIANQHHACASAVPYDKSA